VGKNPAVAARQLLESRWFGGEHPQRAIAMCRINLRDLSQRRTVPTVGADRGVRAGIEFGANLVR
jgi:hypothetical protein